MRFGAATDIVGAWMMMRESTGDTGGKEAFGQRSRSLFERLGGFLSLWRVRHILKGRRDLDVLDIGCGYQAILLRAMDSQLRSGVGIDRFIEDGLEGEKYTFHRGDLAEILPRLSASSFDAILMVNVLEHLWDALSALRESHRLLRPGGVLFVNVPSWFGKWFLEIQARQLGGDTSGEVDDHKMYYGRRDLWPLLVRAGFRPSRIRIRYHKFGLCVYAVAVRDESGAMPSSARPGPG